jgi:hypothetical protein
VIGEIEVLLRHPAGAERIGHRAATEAWKSEEALGDDLAQPLIVDAPGEHQERDHHHGIGGPLHQQPGTINRRHAFAAFHCAHFRSEAGAFDLRFIPMHRAPVWA